MTDTTQKNHYISHLAEESLTTLDATVLAAREALDLIGQIKIDTVGGVNVITGGPVIKEIKKINVENSKGYEFLKEQPAIARVVVEDENGQKRTYYICRGNQGMPDLGVVSYLTPIGRLASLSIGDELDDPKGRVLTVLERAQFRLVSLPEGLDSQETTVEARSIGQLTVGSLRAALRQAVGEEEGEDLLAQILAADRRAQGSVPLLDRAQLPRPRVRPWPDRRRLLGRLRPSRARRDRRRAPPHLPLASGPAQRD